MKISIHKEVEIYGQWVSFGYSFARVGFGFAVDRYSLQIDFLFFWFGVDFK